MKTWLQELEVTARTAELTARFMAGEVYTTPEVADLCGLTVQGAHYMLDQMLLSRTLALAQIGRVWVARMFVDRVRARWYAEDE